MIAKEFSKLVTNLAQDPKHYAKAYASYVDSKVKINREIYDVFLNLYRYGGLIDEITGDVNQEVFSKDYWNVPLWIKPIKINGKEGTYDNMMISGLRLAKAMQGKLQEDDPLTINLTYESGNIEITIRDMLVDYGIDVASLESNASKEVSIKLKTIIICNNVRYDKGAYVTFDKNDLDSVVFVVRTTPVEIQAMVTSFLDQQVETIVKTDSVIAILDLLGSKDSITVADIESKLNASLGAFQNYDQYVNKEVLSIAQNTLLSGDERIKQIMSILNDEVVAEEEEETNQVYFDDELEMIFNSNAYTGTEASAMWNASCASDAIQNSVAIVGRVIGATGKVIYSVTKTVASAVSRLWRKYITPAYQSKDFVMTESKDVDAYVDVPLIIQGDSFSGLQFNKADIQRTALLNLSTPVTKNGSINLESIMCSAQRSMEKPILSYQQQSDNNVYFKVTKTGHKVSDRVTFKDSLRAIDASGRIIESNDVFSNPKTYKIREDIPIQYRTLNRNGETLYDSISKMGGLSKFGLETEHGLSINLSGMEKTYNSLITETVSRQFQLFIENGKLMLSYVPSVVTGHFDMSWADRQTIKLLDLPANFGNMTLIYNSINPLDPSHSMYYNISSDGRLNIPACVPVDNDVPVNPVQYVDETTFEFVIYSSQHNAWLKLSVLARQDSPAYADSNNYYYGRSEFSVCIISGGHYDVLPDVVPEWNDPSYMKQDGQTDQLDNLSFATPGVYDVILINVAEQQSGINVTPLEDGFVLYDGRRFKAGELDGVHNLGLYFNEVEDPDVYYVGEQYYQGDYMTYTLGLYDCYHSVEVTYLPMYGDGHSLTLICSFTSSLLDGNMMNDYRIEYQSANEYYDAEHPKFIWDNLRWSWYSAPITELSAATVNQILNDVAAPIDEGTALTIKNAFMCMQMINKDDTIRTMIYLVPTKYNVFFNESLDWRMSVLDYSSNMQVDGRLVSEQELYDWLSNALSDITRPRNDYELEEGDKLAWRDLMAARKLTDMYLWCLANPNLVLNDYFRDHGTEGWILNCSLSVPTGAVNNAHLVEVVHSENFNTTRLSESLYSIMLGAISMKPSYMRALYLLTGEFPEFSPYLIGDRLLAPRWHVSTDDDIQGYVDKMCTVLVLTAAVIAAAVLLKVGSVSVKKFFMKKQASLDIKQLQANQRGIEAVTDMKAQEDELRLLKQMSKDSTLSDEDRAAYKDLWREANNKLKTARKSMNTATNTRYSIDRSRNRWTKVAKLFGVTLSSSDTLLTAMSTEAILGDNQSSFFSITESVSDSVSEEADVLENVIDENHSELVAKTISLEEQNNSLMTQNREIQQSVSDVGKAVAALGVLEVLQILSDKMDALQATIGTSSKKNQFNEKGFET